MAKYVCFSNGRTTLYTRVRYGDFFFFAIYDKNQIDGPKTNIDPERSCEYVPFYDPTTLVTTFILRSYRVQIIVVSFH